MPDPQPDSELFYKRALTLAVILLLGFMAFQVLRPFFGALLWSAILAVTAWPLQQSLMRRLGGRKRLSIFIVVLLLACLLVVPLVLLAATVTEDVGKSLEYIQTLISDGLPPPSVRVAGIPFIGPKLYGWWVAASAQGTEFLAQYEPQLQVAAKWGFLQAEHLILAILELLVAVVLAGLLLSRAKPAAAFAEALAEKLGGQRGLRSLEIAERTIRAVSLGVVATAFAQGLLATAGFLIIGLPIAAILGFASFVLAVMQIGPAPVWIPVAIWLAMVGETGEAIFIALWGLLLVNTIDNILRPYLIGRRGGIPMIVAFIGALGGLFAWGVIGIFLGPTLLAIAYELAQQWVLPKTPPPDAEQSGPGSAPSTC
jgi:predicted PurR-regulated permease PerM